MFRRFGLTPEIVECFVGYPAGHNRSVREVIVSRDIDLARPFGNEFVGMEVEPVTLDGCHSLGNAMALASLLP